MARMKAKPRRKTTSRKRPTLPYIKEEQRKQPSRRLPVPMTVEQRLDRIERILKITGTEIMRGQKSSIYPVD
jgi:hypothetical protein